MADQPLEIWNTLSRSIEPFVPIDPKNVRIYSCGPTVYRSPHIGGLRHYVTADVLGRLLRESGYGVTQIINITDVGHLTDDEDQGEDKMEIGAREMQKTAREVATYYAREFMQDLERMHVTAPKLWAYASEHIPEQISFIQSLEEKGFVYRTGDGMYFDTSKSQGYGELARLDIEGLKAGARVELNPEKKHPTDFALWKFSPKESTRQMEWESPWGVGFPGWHIECSAMSYKHLGFPFDIHTSAIDHIPVHHTNEIAQNEALFGARTVNYWVHNGHLLVDNQKMAKSLGNTYRLEDLIETGYDPLALRYFFFTAHYRSQQNFTWEALKAAQNALQRLFAHAEELQLENDGVPDPLSLAAFQKAVRSDLNMPQALASLWELLGSALPAETKKATLKEFDTLLGFNLFSREVADIPSRIQELVAKREEARTEKNWAEADRLREEIEKSGFVVKDTENGPKTGKR